MGVRQIWPRNLHWHLQRNGQSVRGLRDSIKRSFWHRDAVASSIAETPRLVTRPRTGGHQARMKRSIQRVDCGRCGRDKATTRPCCSKNLRARRGDARCRGTLPIDNIRSINSRLIDEAPNRQSGVWPDPAARLWTRRHWRGELFNGNSDNGSNYKFADECHWICSVRGEECSRHMPGPPKSCRG